MPTLRPDYQPPADRRVGGNRLAHMQQALIDALAAGDIATSESAAAEMRLALRASSDPASSQVRAALDALQDLTKALRMPQEPIAPRKTRAA